MDPDVKLIADSLREFRAINKVLYQTLRRLEQSEALESIIREINEEWAAHFDRELTAHWDRIEDSIHQLRQSQLDIFRLVGEILDDNRIKAQTKELQSRELTSRLESLKRQLATWHTNLNVWQEEDARHGGNPPIHITTSIIQAQERIEEIEEEIRYFQSKLE